MKTQVYNTNNEIVGETDLPDRIFGRPWNPDLVHQALAAQMANRRQPTAHTKTRGEVRGGGKKPWRQKGTGRARHGSIRSPLWVGGGVTFGPRKERIFAKKINQKMVRGAVHAILSRKFIDGELKVVDSLALSEPKTKLMFRILKDLQAAVSVLLVPTMANKAVRRAAANLPKVASVAPDSLNVYDLLRYKQVIIDKEAVASIR